MVLHIIEQLQIPIVSENITPDYFAIPRRLFKTRRLFKKRSRNEKTTPAHQKLHTVYSLNLRGGIRLHLK